MLVTVLAVAVMGLPHATVRADEHDIPQTIDELLEIYGIADQPADYVVVVDTSGSMMYEPPIYPQVREVYRSFTQAIGDHDHLAVITFDTNPVVRFNGELAGNRPAAESALPETAAGNTTDIGLALDAAMERLERPEGSTIQTLIFLTDGQIIAPGSIYEGRGSAAWQDLAARAARLAEGRSVAVYGAGLGGGVTDIDSLKDVFPRAKVVSIPNDQLAAFFAEAVQRARIERLRVPITQELERDSIHVSVAPGELANATTFEITLESKLPHLGATINLTDVTVMDTAGKVLRSSLVGGQQTLTLGPGEASEPILVTVQVPDLDHNLQVGARPDSRDFEVRVEATTNAEPQAILVNELGVTAVPLLTSADLVTAERNYGIPYWMLGVAAGVLFVIFLLLRWFYRRFFGTPGLPGGIRDASGKFVPFRGKRETVPNSRIMVEAATGSVEFFTRPRQFNSTITARQPKVFIRLLEGGPSLVVDGIAGPIDPVGEEVPPYSGLKFTGQPLEIYSARPRGE